ncbi:hypothetical protein SAMN05443579_106372 [Variovorax sp. PDC80]|uniref:hypothetical protein n=1 Tax=Variovorax sp. PDC80 TaxID=1882827 RepID=UPI0008ECC023|nr:hypothetical protein [Variovorax sp. PDC80]SFO83031.1 hypothetical protein SAMN05443579_106372 [Variovorax sp. PDC80]
MSIVLDTMTPEQRRRQRTRRLLIIMLIAGLMLVLVGLYSGGAVKISTWSKSGGAEPPPVQAALLVAGFSTFIIALAFSILAYLRPVFTDVVLTGLPSAYLQSKLYSDGDYDNSLKALRIQLADIQKRVYNDRTGDAKSVAEALRPSVQDAILQSLESRYATEVLDADRLAQVRGVYVSLENRIRLEIESLGLKGNINLTIGVITTLLAVGTLTVMVFTSNRDFKNLIDVASHYVPRLALVVFIEIFSFFFLRLYRSTLDEIRRYQEKLNDAATQRVALELAWALNDPALKADISKALIVSRPQPSSPTGPDDLDVNAVVRAVGQLSKLMPAAGGSKTG